MVSLCSAHQYASNDIHVDLEVTLRARNLRSTVDLDLMRASYTQVDAYQWEDLYDTVCVFALARLVHK